MSDLKSQIALQNELNKALEAGIDALERRKKSVQQSNMFSNVDEMINKLDQLSSATEKLTEESKKQSEETDKNKTSWTDLLKVAASATGALKGFRFGLSIVTNIVKGFGSAVMGVVDFMAQLTKWVITFPFGVLSALVQLGQKLLRPSEAAFKLEEVRDLLGDIADGPAKNLVTGTRDIRKGLDGVGISFSKIFGSGPEGMAEALQFNMDLAKGLGSLYDVMSEEIKKNGAAIVVFTKGMGLTTEEAGKFMAMSRIMGRDWKDELAKISTAAKALAKKFGISSKGISRDTVNMMLDMEHFGDMTKAQAAGAAAHFRQMGVEIKTAGTIFDKFMNFESGAKAAAMLRRQFGMLINPVSMIGKNAAEMQQTIRDEFRRTGQSFAGLTQAQKLSMSSIMGISMEQAAAYLDGNAELEESVSLADKAANATISQGKVLQNLAKDIKRMLEPPRKEWISFFHAFSDGFLYGVNKSKPFQKMLRNIGRAIVITEKTARKVGKAFVEMFPGVKKMVAALGDLFEPRNWRKAMQATYSLFVEFFNNLQKDPAVAVDILLSKISSSLKSFIGPAGGGGTFFSSFIQAFDTFGTTIGNIGLTLVNKAFEALGSFFDGVGKFITNMSGPKKVSEALADAFGGSDSGFMKRFGKNINALVPTMISTLKKLLDKVIIPLWEQFEVPWKHLLVGGLIAATPAIVGATVGALISILATSLVKSFKSIAEVIKGFFTKAIEFSWKGLLGGLKAITKGFVVVNFIISAVEGLIKGFSEAADDKSGSWLQVGQKFVLGLIAGFAEALTFGLIDADSLLDDAFGGTRVYDKMMKTQAKYEKEVIDKFISETSEYRKKLQEYMSPAEFAKFQKEQDDRVKLGDVLAEAYRKSTGSLIDSDIEIGVKHFDGKVQREIYSALVSGLDEASKEMVTLENGLLKIDDDFYQKNRKRFESVLLQFSNKEGAKNYENAVKEAKKKSIQDFVKGLEANKITQAQYNKLISEEQDQKKRDAIIAARSAIIRPLTAEEQQELKLKSLEDTKELLDKINAIQNVPELLKKAQSSIKKINVEEVKGSLKAIFDKAGNIAEAANKIINDRLEGNVVIDTNTVEESLDPIVRIGSIFGDVASSIKGLSIKAWDHLDEIIGKVAGTREKLAKLINESTGSNNSLSGGTNQKLWKILDPIKFFAKSIQEIYDYMDSISVKSNVFELLSTSIQKGVKKLNKISDAELEMFNYKMNAFGITMQQMYGEDGLFRGIPEEALADALRLESVVDKTLSIVKKINSQDMDVTVDLTKTLSNRGEVSLKFEHINLNMNLQVHMDAEQVAKGVSSVTFIPEDAKHRRHYVTEKTQYTKNDKARVVYNDDEAKVVGRKKT